MKLRKGFTLIELLVVIAIIALLMSILMPALTRVSDQAKYVVCKNNLHQLAIAWKMYLDENKNKFPESMGDWITDLLPYYKDLGLLICPYAKKTLRPVTTDVLGDAEHAWGDNDGGDILISSFGLNQYCSSEDDSGDRSPEEVYYNATIKNAYKAPLMGDCANSNVTPQEKDIPPRWPNDIYPADGSNDNEIRSFCINRHNWHINLLFLDWSVRKVGLKELWILRWSKNWNLPPDPLPTEWDDPDHWMFDLPNPL
jgi:prepilin-type N-terminal cleavage/methylation domain-containing protein